MARLANQHSGEYHVNFFIPDLHSIISPVDGDLAANIVRNVKYYLAAGLEVNENVHIYRQSYVPAHSELAWILNCTATMGELMRMTQYKEKGEGKSTVNAGVFDYPVLMAADILLYDATYVPVGEDQYQHLELTRDLAIRVNHKYKEVFTVPARTKEQAEFMGLDHGIRIRDLLSPEKKMSKSTPAENSKIMLTDAPELARKKIMSATTDSLGKIKYDMWGQPGISNLLQIEALTTGVALDEVVAKWSGETRYGELKKTVAESVATMLSDFQARVAEIPDDTVYRLFDQGEQYANKVANAKLLAVQQAFRLR